MAHGNIIICRADQVVKKCAQIKPAAVLSIEHPGVQPGEHGAVPRLNDGTPQKILTFWDSEHRVTGGPDPEQVQDGIAFALEHLKKGDVIIHCHAGISRSTGVALGVLSALYPHDAPEQLIEKLMAIRPRAAPNIIVVEQADTITGRNGTLLKAVNDNIAITTARKMAEMGRTAWLIRNPETYKKMHPEKFPDAKNSKPPQP
jgi:predicted protein tyrosine phosphatase